MNYLYYGDCLTVMLDWPSQCVDLIYLDPPFNSNRQYNAIYRDETGRPLPDQIEAFCDMWELDEEREKAIRAMPVLMRDNGIDDTVAELWRLWMRALRGTQPRLLAYLSYMAERLLIMHRVLKSTGSLYLHCDPTASHYVKALLDAIFGHQNFQNEIIWRRTSAHNSARRWGPIHDTILMYSKTEHYQWNRVSQAYDESYLDGAHRYEDEQKARNFAREVMDLEPVNILGIDYPRMQILTVGEILEGKRFVTPTVAGRHSLEPRLPGIPA